MQYNVFYNPGESKYVQMVESWMWYFVQSILLLLLLSLQKIAAKYLCTCFVCHMFISTQNRMRTMQAVIR